jgi:hypothetical protein
LILFNQGNAQSLILKGVLMKERCTNFKNMLYPQYKEEFEKTIPKSTWLQLKQEAHQLLQSKDIDEKLRNHLNSIVNGRAPWDYHIIDDRD